MRALIVVAAAFAALSCLPAVAQTRAELVNDIIREQGLEKQIEESLEQSRQVARQMGQATFAQMLRQVGELPADKRARLEAVMQRYTDNATALWKAEELVALWKQSYGNGLTDDDLKQILAYYRSPIGAKDVAAMRATTRAFTTKYSEESQVRMRAAIQALVEDLKKELAAPAK